MRGYFVGLLAIFTFYLMAKLFKIIFKIISRLVFFNKCNEKSWKALIPIYTDLTKLEIAGLNYKYLILLYVLEFFSIAFISIGLIAPLFDKNMDLVIIPYILTKTLKLLISYNINYNISKKFNKNKGLAVLLIFFEPIIFLIIGVSKSYKYNKNKKVSKYGILFDKFIMK